MKLGLPASLEPLVSPGRQGRRVLWGLLDLQVPKGSRVQRVTQDPVGSSEQRGLLGHRVPSETQVHLVLGVPSDLQGPQGHKAHKDCRVLWGLRVHEGLAVV